MTDLTPILLSLLQDILQFSRHGSGIKLRSYQQEPALAIVDSVRHKKGLTFVVIFPRQSGKNELQAQIEAFLLLVHSPLNYEIVKVSPTWKPQSLNAMRRLERALKSNFTTRNFWKKESGYIYRLDTTRIFFLSGSPTASIVGATASLLLEVDEAQDIGIEKFDKEINPMAASTNATRVFWGTAWTSQTLLARERRAAEEAEKQDGIRRVFHITADEVGKEAPAYKKFVASEVAKLGRGHPFVRTQFYSEEIDELAGMFTVDRIYNMMGKHEWYPAPPDGKAGADLRASPSMFAFLVDVGGEEQGASSNLQTLSADRQAVTSNRDSTALTIVEIDLSAFSNPSNLPGGSQVRFQNPLPNAPRYLVRHRRLWTGASHVSLYAQLAALAELWQPRTIVIDATGIGAGLAAFIGKTLGGDRVIPFVFSSKSKSDLGWQFLAIVETCRYLEYLPETECLPPLTREDGLQRIFWQQVRHCQLEILPGPGRMARWGVPDGTRDALTGEVVHDDLLISAALCVHLDSLPWGTAESSVVKAADPLSDLQPAY